MTPARKLTDSFLYVLGKELYLDLSLDENGLCPFRLEDQIFTIDVPEHSELFTVSTVLGSVQQARFEEAARKMLDLNCFQQETRGACIALDPENGREVILSYSHRVSELSSKQFITLLDNFLNVCVDISKKLSGLVIAPKDKEKIVRLVK